MTPPPLPNLKTDTALAIFAHHSVKSQEQMERADRLTFLGKQVLRMVIAETLFDKTPAMDPVALDIDFEARMLNSDEFYERWVSAYGLRSKVTCTADHREDVDNSPQVAQQLFDAYVGAVYVEQGYSAVKAWIRPLEDPNYVATSSRPPAGASTSNPPPPNTSQSPPTSPGASGAFLAMFNEKATQLEAGIEWRAKRAGSAHAPTWTVECVVDGQVKGTGVGKKKPVAKEEAARQADQTLGWAVGE